MIITPDDNERMSMMLPVKVDCHVMQEASAEKLLHTKVTNIFCNFKLCWYNNDVENTLGEKTG